MKLFSLEKTFEEACNRHPHLKLLESQWRFDKELISKALQNISSIFPHYSRHDASHSKQIIVNIERLLGSRIKHLTATDIWLILEAAYNHDIGMVVTHKQIEDMDSPQFAHFVNEISELEEHPLNSFAKRWIDEKAKLPNGTDAHKFFNKYIQLISEWYRKKHPENSAKIVKDPFLEIGLDSPRNELLPNRLFLTLATICRAHGEDFEKVLELPFSEAGMATEDCHPRYVAFLLRMGDLLDIDDNRFCPVMMRMAGENLPNESQSHLEKHKSLRHFRLDSERIEIKVVCPSPESYEQAHQWFKWLEEEHYKQSQHWHKIAPTNKLGRLPTLSSPDVSIEKPFITIEPGKKPRFKVDETATLRILRSTGLYNSRGESIREILQNAVDATLFSIWIKNEHLIKNLNPASKELHKIYDENKIKCTLTREDENSKNFELTITDRGTGISTEDLKFILQVGSSNKNKRKRSLKNKMPLWYRPSGNFGIGLQSIYLLSNSFVITTKSIDTHEALEVTFSSGGQSVVIKELDNNKVEYGTSIKLKIPMDEFPSSVRIPQGTYANSLFGKIQKYDFTKEGSSLIGFQEIEILSAIHEFNLNSPIKIHSENKVKEREEMFFSESQNLVLSHIKFGYSRNRLNTLFRGQRFEGLSPNLELVECSVDYYGHQASDFLSYNREKILSDATEAARKELCSAIVDYISRNFDALSQDDQTFAAGFNFLFGEDEEKYTQQLMDFLIPENNEKYQTLQNILKKIEDKVIRKIEIIDNNPFQKTAEPEEPETLLLSQIGAEPSLAFIKYFATKNGMFWQESNGYANSKKSTIWSDADIQPTSDDILNRLLSSQSGGFYVSNRLLFPAWSDYRKLSCRTDINTDVPWAKRYPHDGFEQEYLVLPCQFEVDVKAKIGTDEEFLSWTFKNRKHKNVEFEEFRAIYDKLSNHLEKIQSLQISV